MPLVIRKPVISIDTIDNICKLRREQAADLKALKAGISVFESSALVRVLVHWCHTKCWRVNS